MFFSRHGVRGSESVPWLGKKNALNNPGFKEKCISMGFTQSQNDRGITGNTMRKNSKWVLNQP